LHREVQTGYYRTFRGHHHFGWKFDLDTALETIGKGKRHEGGWKLLGGNTAMEEIGKRKP